jgi:hypothetical protein
MPFFKVSILSDYIRTKGVKNSKQIDTLVFTTEKVGLPNRAEEG